MFIYKRYGEFMILDCSGLTLPQKISLFVTNDFDNALIAILVTYNIS